MYDLALYVFFFFFPNIVGEVTILLLEKYYVWFGDYKLTILLLEK